MIENTIRKFRYGSGRVNRWRVETDQAVRWLATGLAPAEEGFHHLSHYGDLSPLVALTTQRDEENLEAFQERLPDWLQGDVTQAVYESDEQSLDRSSWAQSDGRFVGALFMLVVGLMGQQEPSAVRNQT